MKFKSALVTSVSGSIGGMTGSHNRGGMYLRARRIPVNPNSTEQQQVRELMGYFSSIWGSDLDDDQRAAWETYARNVTTVGKLGDTLQLSGFNMFIRSNVARAQAGLASIFTAPTEFNLGVTPTVTVTDFVAPGTIELTCNVGSVALVTDNALLYISRPMSAGINFFKGPYRYIAKHAFTTGGVAVFTGITAPFPFAEGNAVCFRLTATYTDGRLSGEASGRVIASA